MTTDLPTTELVTTTTPTTLLLETCGGPEWRRVAFINMTDPNQNCPQGLTLTGYFIRSCGRTHTSFIACSSSVTFPVDGSPYTQACGRITAYRWGLSHGFNDYYRSIGNLNSAYVDEISLTHGSPPQTHIWTFVSGQFSGNSSEPCPNHRCPCNPGNTYGPPAIVGNDYFCESVTTHSDFNVISAQFFSDNALWDSQDLLNSCYGLNNQQSTMGQQNSS